MNSATGNAINPSYLPFILLNNMKVLFFCILFSFVYGAGAMFILIWNASVGGAFIAAFIKTQLLSFGPVHSAALGFFRYIPHGIIEMAAYFVGGLAGGIVSVAVIKKDISTKNFIKIVFDSTDLILIAVVLLVIGSLVEVFVTPAIVSALSALF
jgi:uncharacterized membrane protein SpoIIM required for sporulation